MDAFFRGLSLFIFGVLVGAAGMLFFTPTFNVVVSRNPGALKPIEFTPAAATAVASGNVPASATSLPPPNAVPTPQRYPTFAPPTESPAPAVAPKVAAAEPAVDFKSISEHLILWPNAVTVTTATTVPVLADGKKVQDLALEVGTVLQVSKVQPDGSLEVRAKGEKFEIRSSLTDFTAEFGKRVAELVAKGTKIDAPFAAPVAAMPAAAPVAQPVVVPAAVAVPAPAAAALPKGPLTLAQKVDVLFGVKPAAPASAVVAPPSSEPKEAEKTKDLDRKINQLFK